MGRIPSRASARILAFPTCMRPAYTLTETLRAGQLEGTQEQFAKVEEQYQCTMDAIRALD